MILIGVGRGAERDKKRRDENKKQTRACLAGGARAVREANGKKGKRRTRKNDQEPPKTTNGFLERKTVFMSGLVRPRD